MAIATNKREGPTKKLIKHYNWGGYFKFLECSDNNALMRNKSQMIANIISSDKDFKDSFYVGDTTGDYKAADFNNLKPDNDVYTPAIAYPTSPATTEPSLDHTSILCIVTPNKPP